MIRFSPLLLAALKGHVKVVETLCGFDCDPRATNEYKQTAFLLAAREKRMRAVRLLLALNAATIRSDRFGWKVSRSDSSEIKQRVLDWSLKSVSNLYVFVCYLIFYSWKKKETDRAESGLRTMKRIRARLAVRLMRFAQQEIVGICLAMSSLDLTPYVLLWIIDFLPNYDRLSHVRKIRLIESVRESIWKTKKKKSSAIEINM